MDSDLQIIYNQSNIYDEMPVIERYIIEKCEKPRLSVWATGLG